MTKKKVFVLAILTILVAIGLSTAALGQGNENSLATVSSTGASVRFDIAVASGGATLTVVAPDGRSFTKEFNGSGSPEFTFSDKLGLPDGVYTYELRVQPALTKGQKDSLKAARKDDESESDRTGKKRAPMPNLVQSGSFALINGQIYVAGLTESQRTAKSSAQPAATQTATTTRLVSANTVTRLRNHRLSLLTSSMPDQVIADDLIVQGSACVGLDCVNNESFGFDTIRLKENNTRITFMDTSTGAGFPTEDWTIRANSSSSGGASFLAFVDQGGSSGGDGGNNGTIVFEVDAGAPANSLKVDSTGKVGLRTATPVLDLHINTNNTPAMRYEQNNSGGFTAQTWDIGANEANFFVRDVTGGSRLPLRIRPGAPTSSIDVSASGNVGIGTASPGFHFHIQGSGIQTAAIESLSNGNNAQLQFIGKTNGGTAQSWLVGENLATTVGAFEVYDNTAGQNRFYISTSGNVGLGTTAPDQKLSVSGDANKSLGGGSWGVFSDERLKDIKGNFTRGLSAVMGLRPLRFSYKKNNAMALSSEAENVGFSAQEVQKLVPEAVTTNKDGYLMVHNDAILWTMLNAIKEQQKEIEQLKGQIRKLQNTSHRRRK